MDQTDGNQAILWDRDLVTIIHFCSHVFFRNIFWAFVHGVFILWKSLAGSYWYRCAMFLLLEFRSGYVVTFRANKVFVAFGHGPADSCGHWVGAFSCIPHLLIIHRCFEAHTQKTPAISPEREHEQRITNLCFWGKFYSKNWVLVHFVASISIKDNTSLLLNKRGRYHLLFIHHCLRPKCQNSPRKGAQIKGLPNCVFGENCIFQKLGFCTFCEVFVD